MAEPIKELYNTGTGETIDVTDYSYEDFEKFFNEFPEASPVEQDDSEDLDPEDPKDPEDPNTDLKPGKTKDLTADVEGSDNTESKQVNGSSDSITDYSLFDKFIDTVFPNPFEYSRSRKPPSKETIEANDKEIIKKDIESGRRIEEDLDITNFEDTSGVPVASLTTPSIGINAFQIQDGGTLGDIAKQKYTETFTNGVTYKETDGNLNIYATKNPEKEVVVYGEQSQEAFNKSTEYIKSLEYQANKLEETYKTGNKTDKQKKTIKENYRRLTNTLIPDLKDRHEENFGTFKENVRFVSVQKLIDKRDSQQGKNVQKEDVKKYGTTKKADEAAAFNGRNFLSLYDKEKVLLIDQLNYLPEGSEKYKEVESKLARLRQGPGYAGIPGEKFDKKNELYDPVNGKNYSLENAPKEVVERNEKADKVFKTTTKSIIKEGLAKEASKLVGNIKDLGQMLKETRNVQQSTGLDKNSNTNFMSAVFAIKDNKKFQEVFKFVEKYNKLPVDLSTVNDLFAEQSKLFGLNLTSDSFSQFSESLGSRFNETLEKYLVLNKAYHTNENVMESDERNYAEELLDGTLNIFGGDIQAKTEAQEILNIALRDTGQFSEKALDEYAEKNEGNNAQFIARTFPELVEFVVELTVAKRASGNFIAKTGKALQGLGVRYFKPGAKLANQFAYKGINFTVPALVEAAEFGGLTAVKNVLTGENESISESAISGAALNVGGGVGRFMFGGIEQLFLKGISKAGLTNYSIFQKASDKGLRKMAYQNFKSATGGATAVIGSGILMDPIDYEYNRIGDTFVQEYWKMFFLGKLKNGMKSPGGSFKSLYSRAQNDILSFSNLNVKANNAAKVLNRGTENISKPNKDSNTDTEKSFEQAKANNSIKLYKKEISQKEFDFNLKQIEGAKKTIDIQVGINQAKENIKKSIEAGESPSIGRQYEIGRKINSGQELSVEDGRDVSNMSIEGVLVNAGLEINPRNRKLAQNFINGEARIQKLLNGGGLYTTEAGMIPTFGFEGEYRAVTPELMKVNYDFLKKQEFASNQLNDIKNVDRSKKTPLEITELDRSLEIAQKNYEEYVQGGSKYEELQLKISDATLIEYNKAISKKGLKSIIEVNTPAEFKELAGNEEGAEKEIALIGKDGTKYVNREQALKVRNIEFEVHEGTHALLIDSFKDATGNVTLQGIEVIDKILESLTPIQRRLVDEQVKSRYKEANESNKKEWYEENLTAVSELMKKEKISRQKDGKFRKALEGIATMLKRKSLKNLEINAETGEGMFEMLKGFAESTKKGEAAADKFAKEAAAKKQSIGEELGSGKKQLSRSVVELKKDLESLNDREFEFSEPAEFDSQVSNLELKIKQAEKIEVKGKSTSAKKTVTAKQTASSEKVQKLYEEKKEGYQAEIIKEFEPIISNIAGNPKLQKLPGYDKEKLMKALTLDSQGLIDMINKYEKDVGAEKRADEGVKVPLAGFVNKYLRTRSIAIFDKTLNKTFTEGLDKAANIAAESTSSETAKDVKLIKATKILSAEQLARAKEIIIDAPIDSKNLSYKKLKGITSEITSEITGVPASKINNPAKNLSQGETTTAAMFISKNIDYIRNTLPEGAVLKGASEKLIGTATGVPKKMLDAFYVKSKRGDNLSPFILRKGLTSNEILEEIGRPKDGKPVPIDPRSPRGSVIKGIIDIVDRNITNELVRTEKDLTPQQRVDAGAGRGRNVFSKTIQEYGENFDIVNTPKYKKLMEAQDKKDEIRFAEEEGITLKEAKDRKEIASTNWKNSIDELNKAFNFTEKNKIKYFPETELGNEKNFVRTIKNLKDIIDIFPNVKSLPKPLLAALKATVGSNASLKIDGKRISAEDFVKMALGRGKGEVKSWMKDAYQPSWGYAGFKGKTEKFLSETKGKSIGWQANYARNVENQLTNPKLRYLNTYGNPEGYRRTVKANRKAIEFLYNGLAKKFGKSKNKTEALEDIVNFLKLQTNHATGIVKGFVPMTMVTTEPGGPKLVNKRDKLTHNEHMIELFNYNKEFLNILAKYKNNPTGEKAKIEIKKLVNSLQQGLTSDNNRILKDSKEYGGASAKVSENIYLNTFVLKGEGNNMIMLGADKQGETLNEFIFKKYSPEKYKNIVESQDKASVSNNKNLPKIIKYSKSISVESSLEAMAKTDKALDKARDKNAPVKKIRVFDFDDTLARTKSKIGYTMPDGKKGKIDAATFAKEAGKMEAEGAKWDFSEFSKVMNGKKGPLFEVAKIIADKRGTDDVFVLTARPADAAKPIQKFLKSLGLNIPLKNITGLADGAPEAKAGWVVGKAAEGYNDFYFADDATGNVKAVKEALSVLDVKSKVQLAKVKFSRSIDEEFNKIIENKTGIAAEKNYAKVKAELVGRKKGKTLANFLLPSSAEDFVGLLYSTLGKGKVGEDQMKFYNESLLKPYSRAMDNITRDKMTTALNFKELKNKLNVIPKDLKKEIPGTVFTKEQAVRVFVWDQAGKEIPGLSKADLKELLSVVNESAELGVFASEIIKLNKGTEPINPKEGWTAGTITTDLMDVINTTKRSEYLKEWQDNVDVMFSEKNLNKMEAAFGKSYRDSMENILGRMKTGTNRTFGEDSLTGRFTDWVNGSTGAIMFFNSKSAILQTLSATNFIDFKDNNVFAAGKAFANQPQYWRDFKMLFNSDYLVERRDGLKLNVNEADIASAAKQSGVRGVIGKLLKLGFTPTQIADSFAIASGGSTFYRTKIKALEKQGLSTKEAEVQAFQEFREKAEESQQSSRPDRISAQQAGPLGRIVLAFANTPAQYARLMKKAARDLKNGRGSKKENISKIVYYGVAQNIMFNALQQALFSISFGDDEEALKGKDKKNNQKRKEEKAVRIVNGMADSILRGTGIGGAIFSVVKNTAIKIHSESKKKNPKYETAALELLKISPPISSKVSKVMAAGRSFSWDKKEMMNKGFSLDNPAYLAFGNVVSAATNIPLDRVVKKINHLKAASDAELEAYKRMALVGGWNEWELGIKKPKSSKGSSRSSSRRSGRRSGSRSGKRN